MKKKLFKKPHLVIGLGVLGMASVVTPIATATSCSVIEDYMIDEMDHETGNSSALYNSMKKEFRVKYINKLKYDELLTDEEIEEKLVIFDDFLQKEDEMLTKNTADATAIDYTMLTTSLSEVASLQYGITLNRRCNVDFGDLINEYNGLRVATKTYLINHGVSEPKAELQMKGCDKNFDKLMADISKEYSYDPFMGVIKSQGALIALFNANNAEAALVASINRLNEFVQQYTFEFRDNAPSYAYYDNLKLYLTVGDDIPDTVMNEVFEMKENQTGDPSTFDRYKTAPGYVLTPYLHS
ncbi:MAG: hypothetical protein MJ200_04790 [Mycoplasmoidaceae bacterium]|nr:hypothetical protein [Mycoplasmoidaceae bacterium]